MNAGPSLRIAVALAACLACLGARRPEPTVFDLDRVGKPVPDITVTFADGTPLALRSLAGKPAYVFLLASWCEPCTLTVPWIKAAYATYGDRVRFVGIDVLDDPATARAYVTRMNFPFPIAIVDKRAIDAVVGDDARADGGQKYRLPADYVIDRGTIVRAAWHGVPVDRDASPIDVLPERLERFGR